MSGHVVPFQSPPRFMMTRRPCQVALVVDECSAAVRGMKQRVMSPSHESLLVGPPSGSLLVRGYTILTLFVQVKNLLFSRAVARLPLV
jgi:hypothetical protein